MMSNPRFNCKGPDSGTLVVAAQDTVNIEVTQQLYLDTGQQSTEYVKQNFIYAPEDLDCVAIFRK